MSLRFITFDEAIEIFKSGGSGSAFTQSAKGQFWILDPEEQKADPEEGQAAAAKEAKARHAKH